MLHSSFSWSFLRRIRPRGRWTGFSYRPFSIITFRGTTFSISNRFTCLLCAGPSPTSSCYSELLIISNLIFITFRVITYLHIWTNKILTNAFTTLLSIDGDMIYNLIHTSWTTWWTESTHSSSGHIYDWGQTPFMLTSKWFQKRE